MAVLFGGYGGDGRHRRLNDVVVVNLETGRGGYLRTTGTPPSPRLGHTAVLYSPPAADVGADISSPGDVSKGQGPAGREVGRSQEEKRGEDVMVVFGGREDPCTATKDVFVLGLSSGAWQAPERAASTSEHVAARYCESEPYSSLLHSFLGAIAQVCCAVLAALCHDSTFCPCSIAQSCTVQLSYCAVQHKHSTLLCLHSLPLGSCTMAWFCSELLGAAPPPAPPES